LGSDVISSPLEINEIFSQISMDKPAMPMQYLELMPNNKFISNSVW